MPKYKRVTKRALVLATTKPYTRHNLPEHTVASYNCDCGFKGAVQSGLANPHCSSCGSRVTANDVATASTKKSKEAPSLKDCASTVSLLCDSCDTHNLMATATAMEFDGKTHCVSCGQGLEYDVADVIDEEDDEVNLDNDTGADDLKGSITATDEDEDSIDDIDPEEDHINASLDDDDEDIEDLAGVDDEDDDASEDDDFIGGDPADEPDPELGETEEDLGDESALGDNATETPVLAMLSKKALATARLVPDANSIHIFAGSHCIATATAEKRNAKVFGTERHLDLIQASLDEKGLATTMTEFNFAPSKLKITASKKLKVAVANVQTDAKARLDAKLKAQANVMAQSLEIASLGFTRDVYSNEVANPLKDAFYSTLTSLGVDHVTASVKVQKIFADAGDEYAEVLLAKAQEIASMSDIARTQLSQTFASMSVPTPDFTAVQAEAENEAVVASTQADSYFNETDNGRLDNPMRPSTTASISRPRGGANAQLTGSALFSRATLNR